MLISRSDYNTNCTFYSIDVVLGFIEQPDEYSENASSITVCASLNKAIERTVVATLIALDASATG